MSPVILDMVMPKMNGSEAYERLKEIDPAVLVLLSSGYGIDGEARDIFGRGCNGFIQKPFRLADLVSGIESVLKASAGNRPSE